MELNLLRFTFFIKTIFHSFLGGEIYYSYGFSLYLCTFQAIKSSITIPNYLLQCIHY